MAKSGIRISAKNINNETLVKVLMKHPMESGSRKNKATGELIPAHFIEPFVCESAGNVCFSATLSGGISANPYLSFKFKGNKGDAVKVSWSDNKGASAAGETKIK